MDGQWYSYDDSSVDLIPEEEVCTRGAYILFYERRNAIPPWSASSSVRGRVSNGEKSVTLASFCSFIRRWIQCQVWIVSSSQTFWNKKLLFFNSAVVTYGRPSLVQFYLILWWWILLLLPLYPQDPRAHRCQIIGSFVWPVTVKEGAWSLDRPPPTPLPSLTPLSLRSSLTMTLNRKEVWTHARSFLFILTTKVNVCLLWFCH